MGLRAQGIVKGIKRVYAASSVSVQMASLSAINPCPFCDVRYVGLGSGSLLVDVIEDLGSFRFSACHPQVAKYTQLLRSYL